MGTRQATVKLGNVNIPKFNLAYATMSWNGLKHPLSLIFMLAAIGIMAGHSLLAAEPGTALQLLETGPGLPDRNPLFKDNVQLSAALAPGSPALSEGVFWKVYEVREGKSKNVDRAPLYSGTEPSPTLKLKPGRYTAEVTYGFASNAEEFDVKFAEPAAPVIHVNGASLRVHAVAAAGGEKLNGMFFTLYRNVEGKTEELVRSSLPDAVFNIPPGDYRLTAHHGLSSVEREISVKAGDDRDIEVQMEMGQVTLSAHAVEDGDALKGATFFIYDANETGHNREIIRSQLVTPSFSLPAGQYRIAATLGLTRTEEDLTVSAGRDLERKLVLNGGKLELVSMLNDQPLDRNVLYRIFGLSNKRDDTNKGEVLRSTIAAPTLFLPRGRYRVESQFGWHNARQTGEIEIKPGDVEKITFVHHASNVRLRLVNRSGGQPLAPVKWTLKYNGSGTVLISQDAEPELTLQDGSYHAIAQHGSKTYTKVFEAKSNNDQIVELIVR